MYKFNTCVEDATSRDVEPPEDKTQEDILHILNAEEDVVAAGVEDATSRDMETPDNKVQ